MKCDDCDGMLARRLTGDLNLDQLDRLEGHLQQCSVCHTRASEYDRLHADLRDLGCTLDRVDPPADLAAFAPSEVVSRVPRRIRTAARWSLAMAAMIACAVVIREWATVQHATPRIETATVDAHSRAALARRFKTASMSIRSPASVKAMALSTRRAPVFTPYRKPANVASKRIRIATPRLITPRRRSTHAKEKIEPQGCNHDHPADRGRICSRGHGRYGDSA